MDPRDTIVVTGTGRAGAPPDTLVLLLQLETSGPNVAEALAGLSAASQACHEALPEHRVTTHGLGVHAAHDHQGRRTGHTAIQQLHVRTQDAAGAGQLVQRLSEVVGDALGVNGLNPELSDTSAVASAARERAYADALARAEDYARLAGVRVGEVLWVREHGLPGPRPLGGPERAMAMSSGPVVEPAEHEVVASVEVAWQLVR